MSLSLFEPDTFYKRVIVSAIITTVKPFRQKTMKIVCCFALLLVSQVFGKTIKTRGQRLAKKRDARSLQFSNFLDRSDPASNAPIKPLPTAEDDVICPPEVQLDTGVTPVTLIIPITDATGCYEFTTPGYGENTRYPNALNAAYECTYEIRLPSPNLSPTFTILKDEFELQRRSNDGLRCPFDSLILKNIVETGQSVDDVESFDNNVQYCDELTEDKCFTVEPGNNNNRFQIIFKANNINRKRGARGLLCF